MAGEEHILLLIEYRDEIPIREPVHAVPIKAEYYRLLHSPGLVQGIAAGDEFKLLNDDGAFEVVQRSGNIAVQFFSNENVESYKSDLIPKIKSIGGVLYGAIDQGLVFTIPIAAGFGTIEEIFNPFTDEHPECEWYYGNVYDAKDGKMPLGWWEEQ